MFRFFFSNGASEVTKGIVKGSIVTGLLLIGFGMLVFILRDIFALLAAAVFFIAGFSAIGYGIRLYLALRKLNKNASGPQDAYRKNVNIRFEEHNEM